jgi:anaerobic selenocysteine-containing dehydrogenase
MPPESLAADIDTETEAREILQLITLRSNDQFNTTVYGYDDRFRGIKGTREVVLMNRNDAQRLGLQDGDTVTLQTAVDDGVERARPGMRVVIYDIPEGCCGGYYPECNVLLPLWHHARESLVPAAKSIPVRLHRTAQARPGAAIGKAGDARVSIRQVV